MRSEGVAVRLAALALALALASVGCASTDPATPAEDTAGVDRAVRSAPIGPVWVFEPDAAAPAIDDAIAAGLMLDGIGSAGRTRLTEGLAALATRLEARHHPLVIDFADGDLRDDAEAFARRWLPARTAARVLARGRWPTAEGTVHLAARCPPARRCVPLATAPTELPIAAWPLAHARRLRFADAATAARAATGLRARVDRPGGTLALVLASEPPAQPSAALIRQTRRVLRRLPTGDARLRHLVERLALPAPAPRPRWWPAPDEVLVVPRLSALARPAEISAEIDAALGAESVERLESLL